MIYIYNSLQIFLKKRKKERKKNVTFQASCKLEKEDNKDLDFQIKSPDDEVALVVRKFLNMYKNREGFKGRHPPKREQNKCESSTQPLTYFKCKKLGHKRTKCPLLKKNS